MLSVRAAGLRSGRGWAIGRVAWRSGSDLRPSYEPIKQRVPLFSSSKAPRPWRKSFSREARFSAVGMGHCVEDAPKQTFRLGWIPSPNIPEILRGFHGTMVCERHPLHFLGLRNRTNLSNLCGHASFVVLALAYLETDVLMLRGYALSGIGLSILFQFYRTQPLWIPIGWNGLFMLINVSMIVLLLKEQNDAGRIGEDPEQEKVFHEVFTPVELSPVDFVRLVDLAERRVIQKGRLLSEAGVTQEEVFLMVEGTAEVESDGMLVGHLEPRQFVGSMAFQQFITKHSPPSPGAESELKLDVSETTPSKSSDKDRSFSTGGLERSCPNYASHAPGGSGAGAGANGAGASVLEEARKAGEAALEILCQDSIVGTVAKSLLPEAQLVSAGEASNGRGGGLVSATLEPSSTTVIATTDVVVYAWDMHLLRAYIRRHPAAGVAVQTAMSADLTRKVDQSRGNMERYRSWLTEALAGGEITPIEKKKLRRFREEHGISLAEHKELLRQNEWSDEEFQAGFQKGVAPRDGSKDLLKYEALVQRELAKGEVDDEAREHLRLFRVQAGIDAQEHLLVLNKQGWSADDYEVGFKSKASRAAATSQEASKKN